MLLKLNLSTVIARALAQGVKVVTMCREIMVGPNPLVDLLDTTNVALADTQAAAIAARQAAKEATANLKAAAKAQRNAYNNLGAQVDIDAEGSDSYIYSTGYEVRNASRPLPPIEDAPYDLRTKVNGTPGRIILSWKSVAGARNYEVQYSTDLSGTGPWTSLIATPGSSPAIINSLISGTKYALRARALGKELPGPWSGPVQQLAP